jgi:hypothetical protein
MAPVATPGSKPRPRGVTAAFWLTLAGSALFLASVAIVLAATIDSLRDIVRETYIEDGTPYDETDIQSGAMSTAMLLMFLALVPTAPFITFAALLRGGRNWARVLLTVLVSIGGFVSIVQIFLPYPNAAALIRVVELALVGTSVAIIILLFSARANRYFAGPQ